MSSTEKLLKYSKWAESFLLLKKTAKYQTQSVKVAPCAIKILRSKHMGCQGPSLLQPLQRGWRDTGESVNAHLQDSPFWEHLLSSVNGGSMGSVTSDSLARMDSFVVHFMCMTKRWTFCSDWNVMMGLRQTLREAGTNGKLLKNSDST